MMLRETRNFCGRLRPAASRPALGGAAPRKSVKEFIWAAILFLLMLGFGTIAAEESPSLWWDHHWKYRVRLTVDVGAYERIEKPVEQYSNFTSLLRGFGYSGPIVEDSLRVVEVGSDGEVIADSVPFQYDAITNTSGNLVFILTGITTAGSQRHYDVYFDTKGSFTPASVDALVQLVDDVPDEGQTSYKVTTANATYYYHKEAGGFSSLVDSDGNDWISFHPYGGSDGVYRGIPNMVHPDNIFHPGHKHCTSSIVYEGPLKVTIHSISSDGLWECIWEIYPYYARMTLLQTAGKDYWFLYEGTPGGLLNLTTDYCVRSNGVRTDMNQSWTADIPAPEWLYFEDSVLDRFIYFVHEEDDSNIDSFYQMQGNMTVFGFGRSGLTKYLSGASKHFTIGLSDDAMFSAASKVIEASYRPVTVTVGLVSALVDFDDDGSISFGDLAILSACWLKSGETGCDIDQDNLVNLSDFSHFSNYWNPGPTPTGALQGRWMLDEGTGSIASDSSALGNHGAIVGATWTASGKYGPALEFDGTDDYVEVKGYKGVLGTQSRTVTAWIKTETSNSMDIVSWGNNLPGESWILTIVRGGGRLEPTSAIKVVVGNGYITGRTKLPDGQWHHVAAVLQEDDSPNVNEIKLYVDGLLETISHASDRAINTTVGDNVKLGIFNDGNSRFFKGLMDDVRIYDRALSEAEIAEMVN